MKAMVWFPAIRDEITDREKVVILGGGRTASDKVSSSIIVASMPSSPSDAGYETIMVNCNLETVSTDYDTSDRLYFER